MRMKWGGEVGTGVSKIGSRMKFICYPNKKCVFLSYEAFF